MVKEMIKNITIIEARKKMPSNFALPKNTTTPSFWVGNQ
jgi:hypothetical protein